MTVRCVFDVELWPWVGRPDPVTGEPKGKGTAWVFVTVPADDSEDLKEAALVLAGFGSIRVAVQIGATRWKTSVFPDADSGCYVLPIKKSVRLAEGLAVGDVATVDLEML